jgi:predicted transcriptional regulator
MGVKLLKTDIHRENLYKYVKDNPKVTVEEMASHLGFTKSQTKHYLNPMVLDGYFKKGFRRTFSKGRLTVYSTGSRVYHRIVKSEDEIVDEQLAQAFDTLPEQVKQVARIVKISNKHMQPPRPKKRRTGGVLMQSSMRMFDQY